MICGLSTTLALGACGKLGLSGSSDKKSAAKPRPGTATTTSTETEGDGDAAEVSGGAGSETNAGTASEEGDDAAGASNDGGVADGGTGIETDESIVRCKSDAVVGGGKVQPGLGGKVYKLPVGTEKLPDFATLTPLGQVNTLTLDVPTRDWQEGFPGTTDLFEWFAIVFEAWLEVADDGVYELMTFSDDGSKVYVDDELIVDHDGLHVPSEKVGAPKPLAKGRHRLRVEWYQGPGRALALQLKWRKAGEASFSVIPGTALEYVKDCELSDLGSFD